MYSTVDGYLLTLDIAYRKDLQTPLPAVMHIHGGGWRGGSKNANRAKAFAEQGFVGISINYRLSGVAIFPAGVHDCKTAIRWVRAHAKKYNIDPNRIGVTGHPQEVIFQHFLAHQEETAIWKEQAIILIIQVMFKRWLIILVQQTFYG